MWCLQIYLCISLSVVTGLEYEYLLGEATFPPHLSDPSEVPTGHKMPLGHQRTPESHVKEYNQPLAANEFWRFHVKPHIPLVLRQYIKDSPAIKLWNDEYLTEHYGDLDVLVEHKAEDRTSSSGRMTIADFIKSYKDQDMYVVSMFPSEMMHEVRAIPSILCGTFKNYTHESNLWISNGGTRSVVHYDADHNLHCMLDGRKDFIMINNNMTTKTNLYFKYKDPGVGSGFSFLDPDSIDMHKFPKIAKVPWTWATLYPGDCIFIPSVYIHQVRGYGRTIAVTTLFTADIADDFTGDDCTEEIMNEYHSMADISFQWTYKKGDPTIDMGYMNVNLVKSKIREGLSLREGFTKNGKFTKKQFVYFAGLFSPYGRNKTKISYIWKHVFGFNDSYEFTENSVDKLTLEQWKVYCRAVESPHGVVTNGTEPVFVRPGERHKWEMSRPEQEDEMYLTKEELLLREIASRDPMLDHLTEEERQRYIKKKRLLKSQFGVDYQPDVLSDDYQPGAVDDIEWRSQLAWKIDDIPLQYQKSFLKGFIPKEFKETFLETVPKALLQKYAKLFEKNRVPKALLYALHEGSQDSYRRRLREMDLEGEIEEEELQEGEEEEHIPIRMEDLNKKRRMEFLAGKISEEDAKYMIARLPNRLNQYASDLRRGVIPKPVLTSLLRSDEENFDDDYNYWMKKTNEEKDEL